MPDDNNVLTAIMASIPSQRPLDPNGVDVYGQLPNMLKAYAATNYGRQSGGTAEAGYGILRMPDGSFIQTPMQRDGGRNMRLNIPPNALAVVHTHGVNADPQPSGQDGMMRFPNYVFSGNQLYVTIPNTNKFYSYDISKWNAPELNAFLASRQRVK